MNAIKINYQLVIILCFLVFNISASAEDVGTAFTYQGELLDNGSPANGDYDILFKAYFQDEGGVSLGVEPSFDEVPVENGLFTISQLDFGETVFASSAVYIELHVRKSSEGSEYDTLLPRQRIGVAPFALTSEFAEITEYAENANHATTANTATLANSLAAGNAVENDVLQFNGGQWTAASLPASNPSPWNTSNGDIFYNSGDVGIGLAAPLTRLHVDSNNGFELTRFDGGSQMFNSFYEGGQNRGYIGSFQNGSNPGTANEDFEIGTSSNNDGKFHITTQANPRISIDDIGQVGVGTTSPQARLEVEGFQFLDPLNVTVSGSSKLQVKNNGNVQTDGDLITNGNVIMNNNTQQNAQSNGQIKYMAVVSCDTNTADVERSYNGTTTIGNVTATFVVSNRCRVNFPTDITARYWVVSANSPQGGVNASCDLFDADSLYCSIGYVSNGSFVNLGGDFTVMVY